MSIKDVLAKLKTMGKPASGKTARAPLSPRLVLSLAVVVLLLAELWVVYSIGALVYSFKFTDVAIREVQSTRINFAGYNKSVSRLEAGLKYEPEKPPVGNPFKQVPRE